MERRPLLAGLINVRQRYRTPRALRHCRCQRLIVGRERRYLYTPRYSTGTWLATPSVSIDISFPPKINSRRGRSNKPMPIAMPGHAQACEPSLALAPTSPSASRPRVVAHKQLQSCGKATMQTCLAKETSIAAPLLHSSLWHRFLAAADVMHVEALARPRTSRCCDIAATPAEPLPLSSAAAPS
jgi:hypothetical protein